MEKSISVQFIFGWLIRKWQPRVSVAFLGNVFHWRGWKHGRLFILNISCAWKATLATTLIHTADKADLPNYDERIPTRINLYTEISKLPIHIIKHSSTSSHSYVGIENNKIMILVDSARAGTGAALVQWQQCPSLGVCLSAHLSVWGMDAAPELAAAEEPWLVRGKGSLVGRLLDVQWETPQVTAAPLGLYIVNKPFTPSGIMQALLKCNRPWLVVCLFLPSPLFKIAKSL